MRMTSLIVGAMAGGLEDLHFSDFRDTRRSPHDKSKVHPRSSRGVPAPFVDGIESRQARRARERAEKKAQRK